MGHDDANSEAPAGPGGRGRQGLIATAVAVAITLAGFGVAAAQESPSTTAPESGEAADSRTGPGRAGHRMKTVGPGGRHGFGGMGIHGEFTVPDGDGGYRTVASQTGEIVSVSDSSIEVRSEDGYTRRYDVDEDTLVNAGRDGIADVATGDEVRVSAVVDDGAPLAVRIADMTNLERIGERRGFGPRFR